MGNDKKLLCAALTSMFAFSSASLANHHEGMGHPGQDKEKCHGVAKKGANDCATDSHSCAGLAKTDFDPKEWKMVKKGTCKDLQAEIAKKTQPTATPK